LNYIERLAQAIRHEVPADKLPEGNVDALFLFYAALLLAKGESVTPEDVHNAWAAWMTSSGVSHPSLVPFSDLPQQTRDEDGVFVRAIRAVAGDMPS